MFKNEVFNRTHADESKVISENLYNLVIGLTLLWGFAANWLMVTMIPTESIAAVSPGLFLIAYFVCCFAGIMMFNGSDNPVISFIGYNLVVIPFGLVLNVFLKDVSSTIVVQALEITALVTGIMMVLGTMFPAFFRKISGALFIALLVSIVVELIMIFVLQRDFAIMDYIVALIFCGYIGIDWGRAQAIPKTVDNGIDSAASLYMDIINLFVRVVSILKD